MSSSKFESVKVTESIKLLQLPKEEEKEILEWIENDSKGTLEILITGRTGVGKSTLVNALVGRPVAERGDGFEPQTKSVTPHSLTTEEGLEIVVWDSPGLQDGSGNEDTYLAEMKEKCSNVDIVVYCVKLSTARAEDQDELSSVKKLSKKFGFSFWEHSIFVLTNGNALESLYSVNPDTCESMYKARIEEWRKRIRKVLSEARVPQNIIKNIPIEAAGHIKKPHLPGDQYWLSTVWLQFLSVTKEQSMPKITMLNIHRITEVKVTKENMTSQPAHNVPLVITEEKLKKMGLFKLFASTVAKSTVTGAATGGVVGAIVSAPGGPATIAGAAVGAGVGALTGGAVGVVYGGVKVAGKIIVSLWRRRKNKK